MNDYVVVLPAHNAGQFIGTALTSIHRQTHKPSEVVVVDDGSTDDTSAVARELGASVIRSEVSTGPSRARNRGVSASHAPVIAFLDADDAWLPEHAGHLLHALSQPGTVFASAKAERFGLLEGPVPISLSLAEPTDARDALLLDNPVTQSATMITRHAFLAAGQYDEGMRLSEDYDLWSRVAEHGKLVLLDEITVRRRIHEQQTSLRSTLGMVRSAWEVRRRSAARRLRGATHSESAHVSGLLAEAARRDVGWAIWSGDSEILAVVREELARTDEALPALRRLAALGGSGRPLRRVSQDLRRATYAAWTRLQRGGIAR